MADPEQEKQAQAGETVHADSLLDEIISKTKMKPEDESYAVAKRGLQAFMRELVQPGGEGKRVHQSVVNEIIAQLDTKLSAQIDEVLHHPQVQKMESAWRGLKLLVDRTNFRENIKIAVFNCSKDDMLADFEDSPEVTKSGLYKHVYTSEYGQFGGEPYGAIIANYEFSAHPQDMKLLQYAASVASMAHAPFITAAGAQFFGEDSFQKLPNLKDLKSIFEAPQYAKWRSFRESEDARYVGLTCPRFLLRLPYGQETVPIKEFAYEEKVTDNHDKYLWGNTAFTFASRLTDSFAKFRWCPNVVGPLGGGAVEDLPVHVFESMGSKEQKIPTEILVSERREYELAEEGFMALTMRKGSDNAAFFSASSAQKPKYFGATKEGKEAESNYKLGTQLPYMFIVSRLAHYIKVIQRENIGSWKSKTDLNNELNKWISQYVSEMDDASPATKSRRPLRQAAISVEDVEGDPGWYRVGMQIRPHFKYMGASFTLSLVGKLDKK
mgnify:CR=1 FL=1